MPGLEVWIGTVAAVAVAFLAAMGVFIRSTLVICQRLREINDMARAASDPHKGTLPNINAQMGELIAELKGLRQDFVNHLIHHSGNK